MNPSNGYINDEGQYLFLDVLEGVLGGLGSHFEASWDFFGTVLGILGALVRQVGDILTKKTIKEGFETFKWRGE